MIMRISKDLVCFQKIYLEIVHRKKYSNMFISQKLLMPYMKKQTQVVHFNKDYKIFNFQFQWIARTVMVQNNNVDEAMQILNGIMLREGMTKRWRLTRNYEKPTWVNKSVL